MNQQDLLRRIAGLTKTTLSERKLAMYFEREHATLAFDDLETLSKKTGVSQSTISRFITKLGYDNFRAFSYAMRKGAAEGLDRQDALYPSDGKNPLSAEALLHAHLNGVQIATQETLGKLRPEHFQRAIDLVSDDSRYLYLMGGGISGKLLQSFSILLRYMRSNFCQLSDDLADDARIIASMEPNAVLLAAGNKRYSVTTKKLLQHFRETGHETIVITDSYASPFADYATVPLIIHEQGFSLFSTRVVTLAVLEALLAGVRQRFEETLPQRRAAVISLQDKLGTHSIG